MDGSAKNFIDVFKKIDLTSLNGKRKYLKILNKVELTNGEKNNFYRTKSEKFRS